MSLLELLVLSEKARAAGITLFRKQGDQLASDEGSDDEERGKQASGVGLQVYDAVAAGDSVAMDEVFGSEYAIEVSRVIANDGR